MPLICEVSSSVCLSHSTFIHHTLNITCIASPNLFTWWNDYSNFPELVLMSLNETEKHCQKGKKQSEILILNNVKSTCWLRFNIYLHFKENSQLNFSLPHPQHHSSSKQMRICCRVFCTHRDSRVFPILGWGHYGGSLTPTGNFLIPLLHQEKISAPMVHSPTK